jgi:inosose dehydratase
MIQLAYGTYGLATIPLDEAIAAVAATGYDGLELTLADGYPGVSTRLTKAEGAAIRGKLERAGLDLVAVMLKAIVLTTGDRRGMEADELRAAIQSARHAGAGDAAVVTFTMGGATGEWPARRQELVDRLMVLGEVAVAEGGLLAVEPHARGLIDSVERAAWLIEAVAHPAIRLNFDVSHYALPGVAFDLDAAVAKLLPVSVHTHVKDSVATADGFRFVLPGEGAFDFAAYFAALERAGWRRPVTVEVSAMVFNAAGYQPLEAMRACFAALNPARAGGRPKSSASA